MRQYEKAAEKLGCWMRERTVGSSQLSRQTGIDAGTIRHILSSTRNMVALARFFGVSLRELMDKLS